LFGCARAASGHAVVALTNDYQFSTSDDLVNKHMRLLEISLSPTRLWELIEQKYGLGIIASEVKSVL
jgi:hypothetical protein